MGDDLDPRASAHSSRALAEVIDQLPAELRQLAAQAIRPEPSLTVSEWADRHRMLDGKSSAEPGLWRTGRTPFAREPMDRLSSSDPCRTVVLMFASQMVKSEIGNNWAGYSIHHSPGPHMIVQPTDKLAEKYSKMRIAPMINRCPDLRDRVSPPRTRDSSNTLDLKEFPGGLLILTGANAPAGLASHPIRRLHCDEIDRFPDSAGTEGDPVELATKRQTTFWNRKRLLTSTPTIEGQSKIAAAFAGSDQRRYFVPCPSCGEEQLLKWAQLKWSPEDPAGAFYVCEVNGCTVDNHEKAQMLPAGIWRPTVTDEDGRVTVVAEDPDAETRGYTLSALYMPVGWVSWGDLAIEFLAAKGDPEKLQVFVNTRLAETFRDFSGESIEAGSLVARCERWAGEVPAGVAVLTAGVDVQADRVEVEVVGWGIGQESWSIAHHKIYGDPESLEGPLWHELAQLLLVRRWQHESGAEMRIAASCIDSGYCATQVYGFCRTKWRQRVWAIKGREGDRDIWPTKWGSTAKAKGLRLKIVGVDAAKSGLFARLQIEAPGPGFCHFPEGRPAEYFEQLTAETREAVYKRGRRRWVWSKPRHKPNEALDLRVYAVAALHGWLSMGNKLGIALDTLHHGGDRLRRPVKPRPAGSKWLGGKVVGNRKGKWI